MNHRTISLADLDANHTAQEICGYNDTLPDWAEELYTSLLDYFMEQKDSGGI